MESAGCRSWAGGRVRSALVRNARPWKLNAMLTPLACYMKQLHRSTAKSFVGLRDLHFDAYNFY